MRLFVAIGLVVIVALPPPAFAQDALRAAVAPGQTVVDAAARILRDTIWESERDGTPDVALATLADLDTFVAAMRGEWSLPARATHREAALAARDYAERVHAAVGGIPNATSAIARAFASCAAAPGRVDLGDARAAHALLELRTRHVLELADAPPAGIDATGLAASAAALDRWTEVYTTSERCEITPEPYLRLHVAPTTSHPLGRVQVYGATNEGATVFLNSTPIDLTASLDVLENRFGGEIALPADTPLGRVLIRATAGSLNATTTLIVALAPSNLAVYGPAEATPASNVTVTVRLTSPLRDRVASAQVRVTAEGDERSIALADGQGVVVLAAPAVPQTWRLRFDYLGDPIVAPASAALDVVVAVPTVPTSEPRTDPAREARPVLPGSAWGWLWGAGSILALAGIVLVVARGVWAQRRSSPRERTASARPPRESAGRPQLEDAAQPKPRAASLVGWFAWIVEGLRKTGQARPSETAREVVASLRQRGFDPGDLASAFEDARYGMKLEPPGALARMQTWADRAWRSLVGR